MPHALAAPAYPAPLGPGSRIAVTAPSSGVEHATHARLDLALQGLRQRGFVVEEGLCLRDERASASAPAGERAAELMHYLLRDDIAAVVPPWGGERAIELLDRLDWAALAAARPKWLLGYSDTSTLLVPLTLHLGWATAHGPCLMDLAPGQDDALTAAVFDVLATPAGGVVEQRQSQAWQSLWGDFAADPACTYVLDRPTRWVPLHGGAGPGPLHFGGRLIGGCLDTLLHLAGGPHGGVREFAERCGHEGTVLYLENSGLDPCSVLRALHTLRWAGWLDGLQGLLLGRSAAPDHGGPEQLSYRGALEAALADLHCPVLVDVDIGHVPPQLTLVNGALAEVHWSAALGGRLRQTLA